MVKETGCIRIVVIDDGKEMPNSIYSLLLSAGGKAFKVTRTGSLPVVRKKIAIGEVDAVVLMLPSNDKRIKPLAAILSAAQKLPVVAFLTSGKKNAEYPFPVREIRQREGIDRFLITQILRSEVESGGMAEEVNRRMTEFQSSEVRFLNVLLRNADGILIVNKREKVLFINPAAREMLGDAFDAEKNILSFKITAKEFCEVQVKTTDGSLLVLELRSVNTTWESQEARLLSLRDITVRKTAEKSLRESEERYALAVHGSKDGLWDWNLKTDKIYFSPQWKSMLGYTEQEIGTEPDEWFSRIEKTDLWRFKKAIAAHISGTTMHFKSEHRIKHKDGKFRWVLVRGSAVRIDNAKAVRIAGSQTDITERKKAEKELQNALNDLRFALASEKILMEELDKKNKALVELSITDGLTKLYNHRFLQDRFEFEFKRVRRYGGSLSTMIIDIDHFKAVNDTYGHQFGDYVLRELGHLLKAKSREVDICGRYGGEEFMIITNLHAEEIMKYANKLHTAVENHIFELSDHKIHLTVSIGVAEYHNEIKTKQEMIERADTALYQAKKDGRNLIRLWKDVVSNDEKSVDRSGIEEIKSKFVNISNQMRCAYMEATDALIKAVDAKDPFAREHSHNVSKFAVHIAAHLKLSPGEIEVIRYAGLLHDIGKIGIKQEIICKKDQLTAKEFDVLKRHPVVGVNILKDVKFLEKELPIILHHHERFDGLGYPYGLKEREIPLGARIVAVADSFDAMTAGRSYKKKLDREKAIEELQKGSGKQYAPEIVEAFVFLVRDGSI